MEDQKLKVLYVDDEENNLISFRASFRRNYNVFTAISAQEGINILRAEKIPIVITDQRMPEMTGVQFLEKIRSEFPDTVRMILTGFSDIEAIIQAINTGSIFRYITKPWDENELRMTIDNALNVYALQEKNKFLIAELSQRVKEQENTLTLFKKYVPESIVEKSLKADNSAIFEGELREVSVMFCDIRNFTEMSADKDPKEVVKFLNEFYTVMTKSITEHNGFVNQFIGDEIFATFGAPLTYPENHSNAVYCSIEMIARLQILNEKYFKIMNRSIEVGIGINTGNVIAGNLGTVDRLEYSITGDTVNTGKRIESLTTNSPNTILINTPTYNYVNHLFDLKPWEPILVKGIKDPLHVFEVLGKK